MARRTLQSFVQNLRHLVAPRAAGELRDDELLRRWAQQRDAAAFEVLLWRHGPMVLRACRRLLRNPQDVEDAFQATFLVLVRKAASVHKGEVLASWLYKVAYRVALRARADALRRGDVEPFADVAVMPEEPAWVWRDVGEVLDDEINRLPDRYRATFVLCYLQGKTNAEAAAELGCPVGTVLSRLAWARERLRGRLTRRGLTLAAPLLVGLLTEQAAALPARLVQASLQAGLRFAEGGAVSAKVLTLTQGALTAMTLTKVKLAVGVLAIVVLGASMLVYPTAAEAPASENKAAPPGPSRPEPQFQPEFLPGSLGERVPARKRPYVDVSSPREGVLLVIGTELHDEDKAPAEDVVAVKVGGETRRFRCLKEGDLVEEGQMLGLIDPALAFDEVAIRRAKLDGAKAEHESAGKMKDEAYERYKTLQRLYSGRVPNVAALEELRGGELTYYRYKSDEVNKRQAIHVALSELNQALTLLQRHEIRSPVRGRIVTVFKQRGEAVNPLEIVLRIRIEASRPEERAPARRRPFVDVPSQRDGVLLVIGTELRDGDRAPSGNVVTARVGGETKRFRLLKEGDMVEEGQMLGLIDPALALDEVGIRRSRLEGAKAEHEAATKTKEEAYERYKTLQRLYRGRVPNVVALEELRGGELTYYRFKAEETSKAQAMRVAEPELIQALTLLGRHEIRSPVRGRVAAMYKHRGEAVKNLETVFRIRIDNRQD